MATVQEFADLVLKQTQERLRADYPASPQWEWERVSVKPGPKYTKVDIGPEHNMSGKYMIENATGRIFGIKGYGVVHKGYQYGSLDTVGDWYWGGYTGVPAAEAQLRWDKDRNGTLRLRTFQRHSDGLHTVFTVTPAPGSDDQWDVRNMGQIVAGPLRFGQAKRQAEKLYQATQPAKLGQPADPELFRRTAPQWNCVDYPGDGPHYTPVGGSCAWCGMTQKQIVAEYDRREAERTAVPAVRPGTVQVKRDGEVKATFDGPDPVKNSNDAFAWLLHHQGMSTDWAIKYEGWEITDPVPAGQHGHEGTCASCGCEKGQS